MVVARIVADFAPEIPSAGYPARGYAVAKSPAPGVAAEVYLVPGIGAAVDPAFVILAPVGFPAWFRLGAMYLRLKIFPVTGFLADERPTTKLG